MNVDEIKNLEKLAEEGNCNAQYELGCLYYQGNEVAQDYGKARWYFENAVQNGSKAANYYLGKIYYNGDGVGVDYARAKDYFEKSASTKNVFSEYYLGKLYFWGDGVEKNAEKANTYKQKVLNRPIYSNQDSSLEDFYSVPDFEKATVNYVAQLQKRVENEYKKLYGEQ